MLGFKHDSSDLRGNGGKGAEMIPINMPKIDEQEIGMVVKVLKSGILTTHLGDGPMVRRFESEFARFVDAKYAVAVNSGTASLHLALLANGITSGDEVILPSFTFTGTAEAVALTGAKPVFADIDPQTYNIDSQKIEDAITDKTRAIIPVDLYGLPAETKVVNEIATKHGLEVVEDAAQAHGALYEGKPPGHFADITCWSFYASKNMTTGEGGMVTTDNDETAEKIRCIRSHGEKEAYRSFLIGHNYRMPEIQAAIGCAQLMKLPEFLKKRRRNAEVLTKKLGKTDGLRLPGETEDCKHSWYLYTVRLREADSTLRDKLVGKLQKDGIGAAVYYHTPIHLMPYYRQFGEYHLPETEKAARQVFSLPVHPCVTLEEIDYIASSVKEGWR